MWGPKKLYFLKRVHFWFLSFSFLRQEAPILGQVAPILGKQEIQPGLARSTTTPVCNPAAWDRYQQNKKPLRRQPIWHPPCNLNPNNWMFVVFPFINPAVTESGAFSWLCCIGWQDWDSVAATRTGQTNKPCFYIRNYGSMVVFLGGLRTQAQQEQGLLTNELFLRSLFSLNGHSWDPTLNLFPS